MKLKAAPRHLTIFNKDSSISECGIRENFNTNKYPNIFVSKNLHERMSELIRAQNLTRTNVRINIRIENCTNIQISNFYTLTHSRTNVQIYLYKQI